MSRENARPTIVSSTLRTFVLASRPHQSSTLPKLTLLNFITRRTAASIPTTAYRRATVCSVRLKTFTSPWLQGPEPSDSCRITGLPHAAHCRLYVNWKCVTFLVVHAGSQGSHAVRSTMICRMRMCSLRTPKLRSTATPSDFLRLVKCYVTLVPGTTSS